MYTRAYYPEEEKITIPENYDGTALREQPETDEAKEPTETETPLRPSWDIPKEIEMKDDESDAVMSRPKESDGFFSGLRKKLPLSNIFGGLDIFRDGSLKLGSEEILLIGVALFLFFTKGGDKECAIMLLLLLFIK